MASIDFPNTPTTGQSFSAGGKTWVYDGSIWKLRTATASRDAYDIAVDNGFVGTEAEWLDSLVGADGATGPTGATGPVAGSANQIVYKDGANAPAGSSGLTYDGVSLKVNGNLESTYSNGDEGGEIFLNKPATNTTITTGVTIDVYQNRLRFFENGGSGRGYYLDITAGASAAGAALNSQDPISPFLFLGA